MDLFDNVTNIVRDDMENNITKDSRISIAAACFSGCIIFSVDGNKKTIIVVRQKWTNYYQRYYFIKK